MAKSENKLARQTYKRAIVDCAAAIAGVDPCGDVGVVFWIGELQQTLNRQIGKLAATELPEVKAGKGKADPDAATAIAKLTAERDAAVAALAKYRKGERYGRREDRANSDEGWQRYDAACRELADLRATLDGGDGFFADPAEPEFDDCHVLSPDDLAVQP